jgi:hypothetical protein
VFAIITSIVGVVRIDAPRAQGIETASFAVCDAGGSERLKCGQVGKREGESSNETEKTI